MIGINKSIYEHYSNNPSKYDIYDLNLVHRFITLPSTEDYMAERRTLAIELTRLVLEQHSKGFMSNFLENLAVVETTIVECGYGSGRDHVVHAFLTYMLGVYLNDKMALGVDQFEWKLAALFHDIGYPVSKGYGRKLEETINVLICDKGINSLPVSLRTDNGMLHENHNLHLLTNNRPIYPLLMGRLFEWGFTTDAEILTTSINDHGIYSALIVAKTIDCLYAEHNPNLHAVLENDFWSYRNFTGNIMNAVASIFLHNLKAPELGQRFVKEHHPLAFLMKMSDELQDWERLNQNNQYNSAENYDVQYDSAQDKLLVTVPKSEEGRIHKNVLLLNQNIAISSVLH